MNYLYSDGYNTNVLYIDGESVTLSEILKRGYEVSSISLVQGYVSVKDTDPIVKWNTKSGRIYCNCHNPRSTSYCYRYNLRKVEG